MRKILIVTLGLVTLGVSTELALARQGTCSQVYTACWNGMGEGTNRVTFCGSRLSKCLDDGSWGSVAGPGTFRKKFTGNAPLPSKTSTSTSTNSPVGAYRGNTSAGIPPGAVVRDHRSETAKASAPGGPPPAAPKGTVSTPSNTTDNSPVVRDHRPGGNAENRRH
jgi:hypothetical protein